VKNIDKAIFDAVGIVGRKRDMDQKELPEETDNLTPEEIAQNIERIAIITRHLSGELSIEEAVEKQNQLLSWAQTE